MCGWEHAQAMDEAETQPPVLQEGLMSVDTDDNSAEKPMGHFYKKAAIEHGLDGGPAASIALVDDHESTVFTNDVHVTTMEVVRSEDASEEQ